MPEHDVARYFIRAEGRVQGVGFRFFVQQNALDLRITGWVRNENDGSVTMEVQGRMLSIDVLVDRLKAGNGFCKVTHLMLERRDIHGDVSHFDIR